MQAAPKPYQYTTKRTVGLLIASCERPSFYRTTMRYKFAIFAYFYTNALHLRKYSKNKCFTVKDTLMQLTIQDGILIVRTSYSYIYTEQVNYANIRTYFLTCGYRHSTAQAIAYGALADRNATIQLAQLVKLLAIS